MSDHATAKSKRMPQVLDSFALVVLFLQQKGWEIVSQHLNDAADGQYTHLMSSINFGEVYYSIIRTEGEQYAEAALKAIAEMPIEIIDPTREQVLAAARLKSKGNISYADCFAAALALEGGLPVLTGDREFEKAEQQGVLVEWLPPNR